ncbi:aspartyl/asparaginyl beta-hydroxylase [Rhodothalassium salexigens DSM 2132]|uniref:Aspartyl/asparaginyl beta-hydroxylase n=2 Tax=Rhodothalassium salexigens TaxID=1086 RepID=A0A4R2PIV2_RHOSA|nr:hypothetical protein [Rhodothalassium salexigens DSM 2132]TCP35410.1 aspartyl/asparaginyl beta-hydroxylase [Rhodothalassium salexigens DSM 2132]
MGRTVERSGMTRDEAFAALRRGDFRAAKQGLEVLAAATPSDVGVWMALAVAAQNLSDCALALTAVAHVLDLQPRNVAALLLKADLLAADGAPREAAAFYNAAVRVAPPPDRQSPAMARELARARDAADAARRRYEQGLHDALAAAGFLDDPRYRQAHDILVGRAQVHVQQPLFFYFPGLPQRQVYDRAAFDWVPGLEAATASIAAEAEALLGDTAAFRPYMHAGDGPRLTDSPLLDNPDWSACYLIERGRVVEDNARRCPATMAALAGLPLCKVDGNMPSVLFSLLRPGTRIEPHHGLFNTRLICHLPLIVPAGGEDGKLGLRVGNTVCQWRRGETIIFDDSIEHEAWNETEAPRVVLLFDIWRPELTDRDRAFVARVFEASGMAQISA